MSLAVFVGLLLVAALVFAAHALRVFSAYPTDEKLVREYFARRGQNLLRLRLIGAEFSRNGPFAKYAARTEHQGETVDHVVGVDGIGLGEPRLWMYRGDRRRERVQ
jgi:hypothetical protein